MLHLRIKGKRSIPTALLSNMGRCRVLHLTWTKSDFTPLTPFFSYHAPDQPEYFSESFQAIFSRPLPNLERLDIQSMNCQVQEKLYLQGLCGLKHLRANLSRTITVIPTDSHPLDSLAGLSEALDCLELLRLLKNLKTLDIELFGARRMDGLSRVTSSIENLKIEGLSRVLGPLLSYVTFPAMRQASIEIFPIFESREEAQMTREM